VWDRACHDPWISLRRLKNVGTEFYNTKLEITLDKSNIQMHKVNTTLNMLSASEDIKTNLLLDT
jgi:hypothetical protein